MSFEDGWAALNLEMPSRVPRTEYSAEGHWDLLRAVTALPVENGSDDALKLKAQRAFYRQWNYGLFWSTMIGGGEFGEMRTHMGHAEYAAGGTDYSAVVSCPFSTPEDVLKFDPRETFGVPSRADTVRRFEEHYRSQAGPESLGVNMTGVYTTCMSGLIDLFGWDMLLFAAGTDPVRFGEVAGRYASWMQHYFDALAEADVPVVMIHDDIVWSSGPFLSPDWYRAHVFPHYRRYILPLLDSGKKVLFTSDGDYTAFVDDIAACGFHGFVMEPMTDMAYVARKYGKTHVFIGNADTRILLSGTREEIRSEVERCMGLGKQCPGFFMAVGNHIPANTPVESALYYNECYEQLARR
jgi:hypothetical protein